MKSCCGFVAWTWLWCFWSNLVCWRTQNNVGKHSGTSKSWNSLKRKSYWSLQFPSNKINFANKVAKLKTNPWLLYILGWRFKFIDKMCSTDCIVPKLLTKCLCMAYHYHGPSRNVTWYAHKDKMLCNCLQSLLEEFLEFIHLRFQTAFLDRSCPPPHQSSRGSSGWDGNLKRWCSSDPAQAR